MKNIYNFIPSEKKWISRCDVRARDHAPKAPRAVWVQSWRSTQSAVDIFNTLRVFTKEPNQRTRNLVGVYEFILFWYCIWVGLKSLLDHVCMFSLPPVLVTGEWKWKKQKQKQNKTKQNNNNMAIEIG